MKKKKKTIAYIIGSILIVTILILACGWLWTLPRNGFFFTKNEKQWSPQLHVELNDNVTSLNYSHLEVKFSSNGFGFYPPDIDPCHKLGEKYYPSNPFRHCFYLVDNETKQGLFFLDNEQPNAVWNTYYLIEDFASKPTSSNAIEIAYLLINEVNDIAKFPPINWTSAEWYWTWFTMTGEGEEVYYGYPPDTKPP